VKHVLFVCVENSCRSQIAEAFATMIGGADIAALSAGSRPSGVVNAKAIASMRERGYDLSQHTSKSVADLPDVAYDHVITMGCGDECPNLPARHRDDWPIPDPKEMPMEAFREVRDDIERRVRELLGAS
jgi:protein-tyrosine-phosphatase